MNSKKIKMEKINLLFFLIFLPTLVNAQYKYDDSPKISKFSFGLDAGALVYLTSESPFGFKGGLCTEFRLSDRTAIAPQINFINAGEVYDLEFLPAFRFSFPNFGFIGGTYQPAGYGDIGLSVNAHSNGNKVNVGAGVGLGAWLPLYSTSSFAIGQTGTVKILFVDDENHSPNIYLASTLFIRFSFD